MRARLGSDAAAPGCQLEGPLTDPNPILHYVRQANKLPFGTTKRFWEDDRLLDDPGSEAPAGPSGAEIRGRHL